MFCRNAPTESAQDVANRRPTNESDLHASTKPTQPNKTANGARA
jgi:hypothetical protein